MRLYHCKNARSFRPLWTLEEMGLPYELELLPFPPRAQAPDFLKINPLGTVPFFECDGARMTESVAICQFLVTRFGPSDLAVGASEPGYAPWLNALYFGEATLTFPQTLVLRYGSLEPESRRVPQVVEDYRRWFLARLRVLDPWLAESEFVAANRFTIADISLGYALMLAQIVGLGAQLSKPVRSYFLRLSERIAFKRAIAAQEAGVPATT
jgi:glutathione S-transferase